MPMREHFGTRDAALALLLCLAIVAYLSYLPRDLGRADESNFLYEAKRIRDGEVMYRDFFQWVTPGGSYVMAFLFWVFGTTIDTARIGTAVLHGLTGAAVYATCRVVGVRRALALLPALAYVSICQPAWWFASWHWFSTLFMVLAMLALAGAPWGARPRWAIVPGLVTGLLIGVQQQKGVAVAAGIGALFVLDHLIGRRGPSGESWRPLAVRLSCFSAGVALIVIPLLGTFVALAGAPAVFDALVRFPLLSYGAQVGGSFSGGWGHVLPIITQGYAKLTFPTVLKYLPLALVPACLRLLLGLYEGVDRLALRTLLVLILSSGSAAMSIWYYPDFIHVAFIAPIFLIGAAEALEWSLTTLTGAPRVNVGLGWALAAGVSGLCAVHLWRNALIFQQRFPHTHETAFGRVAFGGRWDPIVIDEMRRLLGQTSSRELFAYPLISHLYLTTGAKNPTPYQYFFVPASPPEHRQRVVDILSTRPVPYVVLGRFSSPTGTLGEVITAHYEPVPLPPRVGDLEVPKRPPPMTIYRRKPVAGGAPSPPGAG
jgi:hypothetical protein